MILRKILGLHWDNGVWLYWDNIRVILGLHWGYILWASGLGKLALDIPGEQVRLADRGIAN